MDRYNMYAVGAPSAFMREASNGEWVKYEDVQVEMERRYILWQEKYAELKQEIKTLKSHEILTRGCKNHTALNSIKFEGIQEMAGALSDNDNSWTDDNYEHYIAVADVYDYADKLEKGDG